MEPSRLFKPMRIGQSVVSHRIVMAPLTRFRAGADHVVTPMMLEYYVQRASTPGTLIIAEATLVSAAHSGFAHSPGIWTEAQIAGWRTITDAVHAKGCVIFCQLIAPGRSASADVLQREGGYPMLSASAVPLSTGSRASGGNASTPPLPREMTEADIAAAIADFAQAGRNAVAAGFDGVEDGYLVDQFTQDVVNRRTDAWGGSVENRSRFGVAVARALADAIGPRRVGFRVSPWSNYQDMRMSDPMPQFSHLVRGLRAIGPMAYLHVIESRVNNWTDCEKLWGVDFLMDIWTEKGKEENVVFLASGFTPELARRALDEEYAEYENVGVVFGRQFVANPDLPFRIRKGLPLNKYDRETFYTPLKPEGYIDYPFYSEEASA